MNDPFAVSGNPDFWRNLMQFGFSTMAAGAQPGATTLGALGQGGAATVESARQNALARMQGDYMRQNAINKRLENATALQGINQRNQAWGMPTMNIEGVDDLTPQMGNSPSMPRTPSVGQMPPTQGTTNVQTGGSPAQIAFYKANYIANGPEFDESKITPQEAWAASGLATDPERKKALIEIATGGRIAASKAAATYPYDVGKAAAGRTMVNVPINTYKTAMESTAEEYFKDVPKQFRKMQGVVQAIENNKKMQETLDKGIISGAKADVITDLGSGLMQMGLIEPTSDAAKLIENTQTYITSSAKPTAEIIQSFGAGTGLSDADREFALKAAAGDITFNEESLRRITRINEQAFRFAIEQHNKEVKPLAPQFEKAGLPNFQVEMPSMYEKKITTAPNIPEPAAREVNKVYDTPKGRMKWTGTGWLPQ